MQSLLGHKRKLNLKTQYLALKKKIHLTAKIFVCIGGGSKPVNLEELAVDLNRRLPAYAVPAFVRIVRYS